MPKILMGPGPLATTTAAGQMSAADKIKLNGITAGAAVTDVQVNGTSVVSDGVANIPLASTSTAGVVKFNNTYGAHTSNGTFILDRATDLAIKGGDTLYQPIVPYNQHSATFYGLAKAAGDSTQSASDNAVGTYTSEAKTAIRTMLDVASASDVSAKYTKPQTGIPASDLAAGVIPDISDKENVLTKSYTTIVDTTVTTATDTTHTVPYVQHSGVTINERTKYRVTVDGVATELSAGVWFTEPTGSNYYIKGYEFLGNLQLRDPDAPVVSKGDNNKNYCIVHNTDEFSGLQIYTSTAGSHTIKIESITYSKSRLPDSLIFGDDDTVIIKKYIGGSTYPSFEIGRNATTARGTVAIGFDNVASGEFGTATGYGNTAGKLAFAEGRLNIASGEISHAEGYLNTASGTRSHAEGQVNTSSGVASHVEGRQNTASGDSSHTEGRGNEASGDYSHAEGLVTKASNAVSHSEGQYTEASGMMSHVEGDHSYASGGTSHAEGASNFAKASRSHVEGIGNELDASQTATHVFGVYSISSINTGKTISVQRKNSDGTVKGDPTTSTLGQYVEVVGNGDSDASRSNARTLDWDGNERIAGDLYVNCNSDSTGGSRVVTIDDTLIAVQDATPTDPDVKIWLPETAPSSVQIPTYAEHQTLASLVAEKYTKPSGGIPASDIASGVIPDISTKADKADTVLTTTLSRGRKANTTVGTGSLAFGVDVEASANSAVAIGTEAKASGATAVSIGYQTQATGYASYAEGYQTQSTNYFSHAEGSNTVASGGCSHASGYGTVANHNTQFVFGQYNIADISTATGVENGNYIEIVGNGTNNSNRSNARALDWSGNEYLAGNVYVNCGSDLSNGTMLPTDVQVNGTSVVSNGVANVDISGKIDKPSNPATGSFLIYNGTNWVAQTLSTWQGGNY